MCWVKPREEGKGSVESGYSGENGRCLSGGVSTSCVELNLDSLDGLDLVFKFSFG